MFFVIKLHTVGIFILKCFRDAKSSYSKTELLPIGKFPIEKSGDPAGSQSWTLSDTLSALTLMYYLGS